MTEGERADADFQVVLETPDEAAIRDELHQLVLADLHGPLGGETEEFGSERPTDRYIVGRLAPDGTVIEPDTQDESADSRRRRPGRGSPRAIGAEHRQPGPVRDGLHRYVAGDTKRAFRPGRAGPGTSGPLPEAESEPVAGVAASQPVHGSSHASPWPRAGWGRNS